MDPAVLAACRDLVARLQLYPPALAFIPAGTLKLIPNYKAYIAPSQPIAVEDVAKRLARPGGGYASALDAVSDLRRVFTNATRLNWRCTEPYRRAALACLNWIDDALAGTPTLASAVAVAGAGRVPSTTRSIDAFPEARACRAVLEGLLAAPPGGEAERAEKVVSFISPPAVYSPPPDYWSKVPQPVCIADVCEALYGLPCRYRDLSAFRLHVSTIFDNAVRYWGATSASGVKALALKAEFEALLEAKLAALGAWVAANGGVEAMTRLPASEEVVNELGAPMPARMVVPIPDWARAPPPAPPAPAPVAAPVVAAPAPAPVAAAPVLAAPAPPPVPDVPVDIPPLTPLGAALQAACEGRAPAPGWAVMSPAAAKACLALLTALRKQTFLAARTGVPTPITPAFEDEVDRFALPHYYTKIAQPRCLSGIEKRLHAASGSSRARSAVPYTSLVEFHTDMELISANCLAFNTDAASADYRFLARTFNAAYRRLLAPMLEGLAAPPAVAPAPVAPAPPPAASSSSAGSRLSLGASASTVDLTSSAPAAGGGGGLFKLKLKLGGGGSSAAAPVATPSVVDLTEPVPYSAAAAAAEPAPAPAPPRLSLSVPRPPPPPPKPARLGPGLLPGEELPFTEEEIAEAGDGFTALVKSENVGQQLARARKLVQPASLGDLWLWRLDALEAVTAAGTGGAAAAAGTGGSGKAKRKAQEQEQAQHNALLQQLGLSPSEQEALRGTLSRPPYAGWATQHERVAAAAADVIKRLWDNEWGGAVPAFRCGWLDYDATRPEFEYRTRFEAHPLVAAGKVTALGLVDVAIQVETVASVGGGGGGSGFGRAGSASDRTRTKRSIAPHPDYLNVKEVVDAVEAFFRVTLDLHMNSSNAAAAVVASAGDAASASSSSTSSVVSPDPKWDLDVTCRASHALRYFQYLVADRFAELLPDPYAAQLAEHRQERHAFLVAQPVSPAGAPVLADKAAKALEKLLRSLSSELPSQPASAYNKHFLKPVHLLWAVLPPDYDEVVPVRMDLSTVRDRLAVGAYRTIGEVLSDLHLTFDNALAYNGRHAGASAASQDIVAAAQWMKAEADRLWHAATLELWEAYHRWHVEGQVTAQVAEAARRVREEAERRRGEQVAAMEAARDTAERRELMRQLLTGLNDGRPLPLDLALLLTPTKEAVADLVLAQALRPGSTFYPDHELAVEVGVSEMPRIRARRAAQLAEAAAVMPGGAEVTGAAPVLQEGCGASMVAVAAGSKRRRDDEDSAEEVEEEDEEVEVVSKAAEAKRRKLGEPAAPASAAAGSAGSFVTVEADGVVLAGIAPPRRGWGSGGAAAAAPVRVALKASGGRAPPPAARRAASAMQEEE